jgi:hypothetical protein
MAEALSARRASGLLRQRSGCGASSTNSSTRSVCLPTILRQQPSAVGLQQPQAEAKPRLATPQAAAAAEYAGEPPQDRLGEAARKALTRATAAVRRYGWIGFWVQVTVSVISAVILLFSVAFTSQVRTDVIGAALDSINCGQPCCLLHLGAERPSCIPLPYPHWHSGWVSQHLLELQLHTHSHEDAEVP